MIHRTKALSPVRGKTIESSFVGTGAEIAITRKEYGTRAKFLTSPEPSITNRSNKIF